MFELIVAIILLISLSAVALISYRKLPILVALPQNGSTGIKKHHIILEVENRLRKILITFEKQIYWHKFLSFLKIMILKAEVQVDHLLHKVRKNAQKLDRGNKK